MNELMEISREEYLELVNRIDKLQASLDTVKNPDKELYISVWDLLKEKPICKIAAVDHRNIYNPAFKYESSRYEPVWKIFSDLIRRLYSFPKEFYIYTDKAPHWYGEQSVRFEERKKPLMHKEMTNGQRQIGADMLNEIIPIYNKYAKMLNSDVNFVKLNGETEKINVTEIGVF